jgi:hypothetical protein
MLAGPIDVPDAVISAQQAGELPPKAILQSGLLKVAQELSRLGFTDAGELATKIRARFVE